MYVLPTVRCFMLSKTKIDQISDWIEYVVTMTIVFDDIRNRENVAKYDI